MFFAPVFHYIIGHNVAVLNAGFFVCHTAHAVICFDLFFPHTPKLLFFFTTKSKETVLLYCVFNKIHKIYCIMWLLKKKAFDLN